MKNRLFIIVLCTLFSTSILATDFFKEENKARKAAYKYRDDISKDVFKKIKKWSRPAILHSDWIENSYGKSLDINGNELFPDIDYVELKKISPDIYVIKNSFIGENTGVIRDNGTLIVPMEYSDIDLWNYKNGSFICKIDNYKEKSVTVYTHDGVKLIKIDGVTKAEVKDFSEYRQVLIKYNDSKNNNATTFALYSSNGACLFGPQQTQNVYSKGSSITFYDTDGKYSFLNIDNPSDAPSMKELSKDEREIEAAKVYNNNVWIKKAHEFMAEKKYGKAIDCFNYFFKYDKNSCVWFYTYAELGVQYEIMTCYYNNKDYITLTNGIQDKTIEFPWISMPKIKPGTGTLNIDIKYYAPVAQSAVSDMAQMMNSLYQSALQLAEQQSAAAERNAQIWGAVLGGVVSGVASGLAGGGGSTPKTSSSSVTTGSSSYSSGSSSSSSSSSSRGEMVTVEKHITCSVCKGSGKVIKTRGLNTTYESDCSGCGGKGYKVRYETVRK